ncbi:diguanylate cyclase response regulator [Geotalea uraniireducens]|uniref:diguanylate cyclase n=1 Tax=Geotalea uraniireducens TaxID=351604 RepID=A0ABN6VSM4_9BACT|nr:diguanylate cyclase [Geotalea uraniireducens]BDV43315.1 diguanylate cyclase response regulator [Geotalea uraniireducens]
MERILVVEDDRFFRQMYADLLMEEGYEVDTVASGVEALDLLENNDYQLVITDLVMPGMSGIEVLSRVKQRFPTVDVIIVTGHANLESAIFALKNGARDYILKPFNHEEFKHTVALCFEQRRLINENSELRELLNLFQIGQNIANCIEIDRLTAVIVDALAAEVGVARAIGVFRDKNEVFGLCEWRGVAPAAAEQLAAVVLGIIGDATPDVASTIRRLGADQLAGVTELEDQGGCGGLLLVLWSKNILYGAVLLLGDPAAAAFLTYKQRSLQFLLEQSTLALENAARYSIAKDMLYVDELTGLFNYRYLDVSLDRETKRADRFGSAVSMIFIDIDFFKKVNDTHGHLVGSRVLHETGQLLKKSVREVDIVIRYGGDEFSIILVETGERGAATVAERIRRSIENHVFLAGDGLDIRLTASLGYACYPDDTQSKMELLELADRAMYRGKEEGKNCIFRATAIR